MADASKVKVRFKRPVPIQGKDYEANQEADFPKPLAEALAQQGYAEIVKPPKK